MCPRMDKGPQIAEQPLHHDKREIIWREIILPGRNFYAVNVFYLAHFAFVSCGAHNNAPGLQQYTLIILDGRKMRIQGEVAR